MTQPVQAPPPKNLPLESSPSLKARLLNPQTFFPLLIIVLLAVVWFIAQIPVVSKLGEDLELKTFDLRMQLTQRRPSPDVVILAFDESTFKINNRDYGVWPYPRTVFADVIKDLNYAGAKLVAIDLMFIAQQKGQVAADTALVEAFKQYKNSIIAMNFDNNYESSYAMGLANTATDYQYLQRHKLNLTPRLDPKSFNLELDKSGFFQNEYMTFNNFRKIMDALFVVGERIGIINQAPNRDGMTRFNPLFFRFQYQSPILTQSLPLQRQTSGQIVDAKGQVVDEHGYFLDANGQHFLSVVNEYYPYLAFRSFLSTKFPKGDPPMEVLPDGTLSFADYRIPLYKNGNFILNWYNVNIRREKYQQEIVTHKARLAELAADTTMDAGRKSVEVSQIEGRMGRLLEAVEKSNSIEPYEIMPAWRLMLAGKHLRENALTAEDQQVLTFFKDKYVFVGNTSPGGFDMKTTPLGTMPGVVTHAVAFDNLHQNAGYLVHAPAQVQYMVWIVLALMVWVISGRARTIITELAMNLGLAVTFVAISTVLFVFANVWLNIVVPLFVIFMTAVVLFIRKYLENSRAYQAAYAAANTDSMTGLYNHRYFKSHMAKCMESSDRFNTKFSLVLIDIDHFKKFNDNYGHQAGDEALRCVARKLRETVRQADTVCRYGGEEMAVIVEKTGEEEALRVAHKVVTAIASEEYPISEGVTKAITISAGVSTYPTHGKTLEELIEFSDKGLYRAKENGRNQVGAQYDSPDKAKAPH